MRLDLKGRHVTITSPLRQLVARKLAKLDRLLNNNAISAQVVLSRQKYRHLTEITLHARGDHLFHGLGEATSWAPALSAAVDKIAQQAHKLKDRWTTRKRRRPETPAAAGRPASATISARLVRLPARAVKPMTVEDAVLHLEEGNEPVVVFRNAATESLAVLYRRANGDLGLIEPEA